MFDFFKKKDDKNKLQEPKLIMTTTEELLMPVRLYYTIHNKKSLIKALRKLKCVLFSEKDDNHFIISYHKEAKKFNLAVPYQEVPKELYPITLAEGYIVGNSKLHIDTRSLRRGVELVDFLVKFIIPSSIIEITAMANYNKATVTRDEDEYYQWFNVNYSELFDNVRIADHNVELLNPIQKLIEFHEDSNEEREHKTLEELDKKILLLKQQEIDHYPDVEKIALHYNRASHEEMMNMLGFRAVIKEVVAKKRYDGDRHFTSFDAIDNFREFAEEKTLQSKFN